MEAALAGYVELRLHRGRLSVAIWLAVAPALRGGPGEDHEGDADELGR